MLSTLAHKIRPLVPTPIYRSLYTTVSRRAANRWLQGQGVFDLALQVADRFQYTVRTGPFQGMKYTRSAILSRHAVPSLIGQYERQIYPALMEAAGRAELIVDVGHAEGYYAVGLARLGKQVVAFDSDWHERRICREMARVNQITSQLSIRRWCSPESLLALTGGKRALIISDIDGGELELFTPAVVRGLDRCDVIVELHAETAEENKPFVERFLDTHCVSIIDHPSVPAGVEEISFLGPDAPRMATEYRPFQQWMIAKARPTDAAPRN